MENLRQLTLPCILCTIWHCSVSVKNKKEKMDRERKDEWREIEVECSKLRKSERLYT